MKRVLFIVSVLAIMAGWNVNAQENVEFAASAPDVAYVETPFQLIYSVNAAAKDLQAPDFQFFEILAGPFESRSSYTQIINGKKSSATNLSYTLTLMPSKTATLMPSFSSVCLTAVAMPSPYCCLSCRTATTLGFTNLAM